MKKKSTSYTRDQLKQLSRKAKIAEVISGLDLKIAKHAIDIRERDLVDIADMAQTYSGSKDERLKKLLLDNKLELFHNIGECPFPQGSDVEILLIDEIYLVKRIV